MNNLSTYSDFLIEVSAVAEQTYAIVVRSGVGEARQVTRFPLTPAELENHLWKVRNALLHSLEETHSTVGLHEHAMQVLGRVLFEFLLPAETRTLYYECQREATHHNRGIRLKLSLQTPALAALPWEFLYDARKRDFVCLDPHTPVVRYTELPQTPFPLAVEPPLQILAVVADPIDMPTRLNIEEERRRINHAVRSLEERGLVQLTWLEGQTWRDLQRFMRRGAIPWHIFHFIGHGGFDEQRNEGFIVLADDDKKAQRLYATQLARLLARQRTSLRLVLLNACEGARTGQHDLLSSTAATLINSGVPAVLAMQYEIADAIAVEFANTFYEALADNLPVDAAVAEARNAINIGNDRSVEWAIPVLYMRAPDGQLFSLGDSTKAASTGVNAPDLLVTPPTTRPAPEGHTQGEMVEASLPAEAAASATGIAEDTLVTLLSAVQQQGLHLEFYDAADGAETPAPNNAPPPPVPHTVPHDVTSALTSQFDISELMQSYAQRHLSIIGFDWVTIPPGEFLFGSNPIRDIHSFEDEVPQLKLHLSMFRISRIPVTNTQYKLFVDATEHRSPSHWLKGEIPPAKEQHPVVNVSWRDATTFCEWAGVRLPTEAEWEKAARGRDGRLYPWGDFPPNSELCNFDMQVGATTVVGSYPTGASPYGVLDMAGNIWEWTASIWLDNYENYLAEIESNAPNNLRRVLRGGGFRDVEFVRCAARSWDLSTQRYRDLGFRVVALA